MNKPIKYITGFVAAITLTNGFLFNVHAKEPSYNGKPLSEIICCGLPNEQYDVFAQLGTNCLPVVLDIMGATDKNMKWVAMGLKSREFRDKAFSEDEGTLADIRESASRAFDMLGTNAVSAVPRLVKILNQNDEITSIYAADALGKVGPAGFVALTNVLSKAGGKTNIRSSAIWVIVKGDFKIVGSMLDGFLKDKNPDVRRFAAEALAGRDPDMAIPLLIPVLDDPDMGVKAAAASSLGSYGAKAKSALPKIMAAYTNSITDTNLSFNIDQSFFGALKAIDLDEAKKAEAFVISNPINPYRDHYTVTKLTNGLELIAGGYVKSEFLYPKNHYLSSAELCDPKTGKWTATGEMTTVRYGHMAVLLPNGKVLVAGGEDGKGALSSAELFDPTTGKWNKTGSLNKPRAAGGMALEPDGKAMIYFGGWTPSIKPFDKELYDPTTGIWEVITNK